MKSAKKREAVEFLSAFASAHGAKIDDNKKKKKSRIVIPVKSARASFEDVLMDVMSGLDARGLKMYKIPRYNEKHRHYELSRHFTLRFGNLPNSTEMGYILEF